MKIEYIDRAISAFVELDVFSEQLETLDIMIESAKRGENGLLFAQYSDGSGYITKPFYHNGFFDNALNVEILESASAIIVSHQLKLIAEIEGF